ncbi:MAG: site-specific DNA-methyltransferase [Candidatus Magnetoovum sp. WYHC-5]|nr:site-specific DNA-methyltransferase [Candidatus Magnetoovum sp. WYHC-5]
MTTDIFETVPLDRKEIKQEHLNIAKKERRNIFSWRGQFSPQLIETLISNYAKKGYIILDPFLGSGTVLYEAGLLQFEAYGTEINPSAFILSKIYIFINLHPLQRNELIKIIKEIVEKIYNNHFMKAEMTVDDLDNSIKLQLINSIHLLNSYQKIILEALIVLLNFHNNKITPNILMAVFYKIRQTIVDLPYSRLKLDVYNSDARRIPIVDNSIDFVVTSPPYINVFNYHQNYRHSVEALGWDVLSVAKSEFGSNRKYRGNRFFTVIQYCIDMALTFVELRRLIKHDGHMIFVVGRVSSVNGTPFYNGKIIAEIGTQIANFILTKRQERVFMNQFGQNIFEDILHFVIDPSVYTDSAVISKARHIGKEILYNALTYSPHKEIKLIKTAINKAETVEPSPIYNNHKED